MKIKSKNEQASPETNRAKKPYQQPKLQVYGDLREITQSHMMGMAMDGSMVMGLNRTNP
jgi:hypothetical protein